MQLGSLQLDMNECYTWRSKIWFPTKHFFNMSLYEDAMAVNVTYYS